MACILSTGYLIKKAVYEQKNFYDRVMVLTVNKLNLFLLLNCVIAVLSSTAHLFVYVFFTSIRTLEKKVTITIFNSLLAAPGRKVIKESVSDPAHVRHYAQRPGCLQGDHAHLHSVRLDAPLAGKQTHQGPHRRRKSERIHPLETSLSFRTIDIVRPNRGGDLCQEIFRPSESNERRLPDRWNGGKFDIRVVTQF